MEIPDHQGHQGQIRWSPQSWDDQPRSLSRIALPGVMYKIKGAMKHDIPKIFPNLLYFPVLYTNPIHSNLLQTEPLLCVLYSRSPWSNEYDPPLQGGAMPSGRLRKLEKEANAAFDQYREM